MKKCYTIIGGFMFDGIFLYRLKDEFNNLKTGRISKINESGDTDFIITIRSQRVNYNLMVSFSSEFSETIVVTKSSHILLKIYFKMKLIEY